MQIARPEHIALLVTRERRLGLIIAPQAAWRPLYGDQMLPLALPGRAWLAGDDSHSDPQAGALALSLAVFGLPATALPAPWIYGPSARHAVDRTPTDDPTAPFLRFERMLPSDSATGAAPRLSVIAVYRGALAGSPMLNADVTAGLLWLSVGALALLVRGERVADALARDGATLQLANGALLPDDGLLYLPSDAGERQLLRIAAKYGEHALFAWPGANK
jgi:hypothetical protein